MENSGKGKSIVIVILVILVLSLSGYIVYDKCFAEKDIISNNKIDINNEVKDGNVNADNNIDNYDTTCDDVIVDYSKLHDMGNGYIIKSVKGFNYAVELKADGTLNYKNTSTGDKNAFNIDNVIEVIYNQYAGEENGEYFILKNDGGMYTITEKLLLSGNSNLVKDEVLGKVIKIGSYSTCKSGAGCGWGIYAVTEDGQTHELSFQSL